jgi:hypothetical protein
MFQIWILSFLGDKDSIEPGTHILLLVGDVLNFLIVFFCFRLNKKGSGDSGPEFPASNPVQYPISDRVKLTATWRKRPGFFAVVLFGSFLTFSWDKQAPPATQRGDKSR